MRSLIWVKVEERIPLESDIFKVKLKNGDIISAYFHIDQMSWLNFYGTKTSHWQRKGGANEFLFDKVLEWKENNG